MVLTKLSTVCTNHYLQYAGSIYGLRFLRCTHRDGSSQSIGFVAWKQEKGHRGEWVKVGPGQQRVADLTFNHWVWTSAWHQVLLTIITVCALPGGHGLTYACVHFCIWLDYCMPMSPGRSPGVSPLAEFTPPVKQGHVTCTLWLVSYFYFTWMFTVLWI